MTVTEATGTTEPTGPTTSQPQKRAIGSTRWLGVVLAFSAVYLVWGSTYLAMKVAVETIPPFLMAGSRFLFAGLIVFAFARLCGASPPTLKQWRPALLAGFLLMVVGNGGVAWGQQFIPTGLAALLVTTTPLFIALFEWLIDGRRPTILVALSLALGIFGMIYLIGPKAVMTSEHALGSWYLVGIGTVILASFGWSLGSVLGRKGDVPKSPWLLAGMQMTCGGALMLVVSVLRGEPMNFQVSNVSLNSVLAMLYLVVFGSWIAYTAFTWLMRTVNPTLVSTYAFVNPVVAVLLGWGFYGETLQPQTLLAGGIIVASVALMVTSHAMTKKRPKPVVEPTRVSVTPLRREPQLCTSCDKV